MRISRKKATIIATTAIITGTAGVAFAYWTTTGSGSGSGSTSAGVADQLSFTQDSLNAMYPGDSAQNLSVAVKNTATESAYVSTVKAYITTDKGADCDGSNFLLGGNPAPTTAGGAVALTWAAQDLAASGQDDATSTVQFNNKAGNQDLCKSAAVTIHYLAS